MVAAIILLCLFAMSLAISLVKHGEPQKPYSFWTTLISLIIDLVLLYFAGFFNVFTK